MIKTITLPAASGITPGVYVENLSGSKVFACISATAAFNIEFKGTGTFAFSAGQIYGQPNGSNLGAATFSNPTANAITITFYSGAENFVLTTPVSSSGASSNKDASTYTKGAGTTVVGAMSGVTCSGLDGTHQRKQFVVTNLDSTNPLSIKDNSGNVFDAVAAGTSKTYFTNGVITVYNGNASPIQATIGEIFYS